MDVSHQAAIMSRRARGAKLTEEFRTLLANCTRSCWDRLIHRPAANTWLSVHLYDRLLINLILALDFCSGRQIEDKGTYSTPQTGARPATG